MNTIKAFLKGFFSVFDITGKTFGFPDYSKGNSLDREAIAKDWINVGNDIRKAMGIIINEQKWSGCIKRNRINSL